LGEVYDTTEIKINRNLNAFIELRSLELEVPTVVSLHGASRDIGTDLKWGVIGWKGRGAFTILI